MYILGISIPLACLLWHLICCILAVIEYAVWLQFVSPNEMSDSLRGGHLAFAVMGFVAYAVAAAPLFVYAYKYGLSYSQRQKRFVCGVAVVFTMWSFPIFVIELTMVLSHMGGRNPLDGIVFVLSLISSVIGGCIVWFAYMRFVAYYIHHFRGSERRIGLHDSLALYPMHPMRSVPREGQPDTI
ncbi:hypothetical protein TraAM80_09215 [Trypanosoma rangeli]|uniref:Transmembrane protein n=1 Tax=Trypanosoma rangeli TaxID=5698 RepID=A0A3R7JVT6_TRYRA|nr:uncharacterized protein TraAM80_09215 [Trypanosoma rangeli]RNE97629.1 hypothetical protein TraAM80_09215 [Trypanosoma rangeli]|eukprot:RNE97629.1 hypothetical protein TraAM80_09215 [Trypanosoma rangeli]